MRLQAKLVVILVLSFSSASSLNHFESSDQSMPQRSHVPKFGGWDEDNVPYTAYFDNARKGKSGVRMNPNDPEENPEAFMYARGGMEDDVDFASGAFEGTNSEKQSIGGLKGHNAHSMSPSDHRKNARHNNLTSESGSEKSSSDHSLLQAQKTGLAVEGNKGLSSSRHSRQRSGSTHPFDPEGHHRAASIPKFGAWDETDPSSGEGFTVIFNIVKEEKQIASTTFPSVPTQPGSLRNKGNSSSRSKFCCCCFPKGEMSG